MKVIPLNAHHNKWHGNRTQNYIAFVDDEDYDMVSQYAWTVQGKRTGNYYAINNRKGLMHRLIMRTNKGSDVHHIDGNGLNNIKENLQNIVRAKHRLAHYGSEYPEPGTLSYAMMLQ